MRLRQHERHTRLKLDWEVCRAMSGDIFQATGYATSADLEARRRPTAAVVDAHRAEHWLVNFRVRTLIGPGVYAAETKVGFDLSVPDYPYEEPATFIDSSHVPWSPHFKQGKPVCIGEVWRESRGTMLLGSLLVYVAHLLNWDEKGRGGGYRGWNGEAIDWHRKYLDGRPLTPNLRYPALPHWLTHGIDAGESLFAPAATTGQFEPARAIQDLFTPAGR